jgi:hypothetical protein
LRKRVLFVFILITGLILPLAKAVDFATYTYELIYKFENKGNEDLLLLQEDYTLPLFINNSWQTVTILNKSHDFERKLIDQDGNIGAIMNIDKTLTSGETLLINIEYKIESTSREKPSYNLDEADGFDEIPPKLVSEYTSNTETFPRDDQTIIDIATTAAKGDTTVLGTVANLLDYVTKNTTYFNFETPRYPLDTIGDSLGDCDDQSILLISLSRSLDIPAYLKVGIIIDPNIVDSGISWEGHLDNDAYGIGWHGWAMIFIPPWGWVPVDLTLVEESSGLEYILNAPEYDVNIIEVLDVSDQAYIGDTVATRERIIQSSLHVSITNAADQVFSRGLRTETVILVSLGALLTGAIFLMFRTFRQLQ